MNSFKKAHISFRIGVPLWRNRERFNEMLLWFSKNRSATDDIMYFTHFSHQTLPLDAVREIGEILAQRMDETREHGFRAGINNLCTIGHHEENFEYSLRADYIPMTDIDGNICRGSFCPNDEGLRSYICELYAILAQANPDYVWIDDDVRLMGHMPITATCFCDNCLSIFAEEYGKTFTRQALKAAFNQDNVAEKVAVRKQWLQHNRNTMKRLLSLIEESIHAKAPDMPIGFMDGSRHYEGYDLDTQAHILQGRKRSDVMWRPGGGHYNDDWLDEIAIKAHIVGREAAVLPDFVQNIQSEVENYPYMRLKKSAHTTALEAAMFLAAGCTGAAYNVLSPYGESLDEYKPLLNKLHETRPFLDLMASRFQRTHPRGIYTGWNKDSFIGRNIDGDWLGKEGGFPGVFYADELFQIGLPVAYTLAEARVTTLSGTSVRALSDIELQKILSSGTYMDAEALIHLNAMGYGELTGFEISGKKHEDCIEKFVAHPLNPTDRSQTRNGLQSRGHAPAYFLKPTNEKCQVLAGLVDYAEKQVHGCCMGIFQNKLGGRVCVAGYYPWTFVHNGSKSGQLKAIMRCLTKDTLPAYVESFHKINLWVRGEGGKQFVSLTNCYMDTASNVSLCLITRSNTIAIYNMCCGKMEIACNGEQGAYKKFLIPEIQPWHMVFIETV